MKAVAAFCLTCLAGCLGAEPTGLTLSYSTYEATPVVLNGVEVNGVVFLAHPTMVEGQADTPGPRYGNGSYLMDYPRSGNAEELSLRVVWTELLTGRGYSAETQVPVAGLERATADRVEMMPIFGPNGLMIVSSDPLPESETVAARNDVVTLCGQRDPAGDRDWETMLNEVPGLAEAQGYDYPAPTDTTCPEPAE